MQTAHNPRSGKALVVRGASVICGTRILTAVGLISVLGSCALTMPQQSFRNSFVPPAHAVPAPEPVIDPPQDSSHLYADEVPTITVSIPAIPRPSDAEFLIKKANDRFSEGKKNFEAGRADDARKEFDKALDILLGAPESLPDRTRVEKRLEELIEAIYRYDADPSAIGDQVVYDKSPRDGILEMTFPVDPNLRNKVTEQVKATVSQLPLLQEDSVIGAINFFSSERGKKIMAGGLRRQGKYKSLIERILAEEGLPSELIFVAQAESGYMPRAKSNKSCVGLWQFAKFRGNEYGLMQTPATDDRMDPEKATRAAARHLHDLYTHFGDWYLALAAYDCGPGCVDHAVARTGYADFFALRRLNVLPKETANYVPVILAMTVIAKNARDYGLDNLEVEPALEFDSIELQTPTHLALIADAVDRPLSELKDLNPALLKSVAPAGFTVHVPKSTKAEVDEAFSVVPPNKRDSWRLHRVTTGDTFAGLAKRYNAGAAAISQMNHEELPQTGNWIAIPVAYPGDRTVIAKASKATLAKSTGSKRGTTSGNTTAATKRRAAGTTVAAKQRKAAPQAGGKPSAQKKTASKTPVVAQKSSGKVPQKRASVTHPPNS